ncbi:prolyl-tRNA synthetase [candidate division WWE3 bacterium CG_4_9_14_0_2_um_filter_35_11]|uniref:Proline--tRNA ligase n=1 Tax=candidate division WWE3 bacterium CG_4_9_14_0_2_um_filter_35_11 TaxID=1975077 RepID=A0A2M8EM57_UNCKA|nr:MAG: prolyl-tRNA synthetase [candidate division WWE3 bacterium CG10_big_fil_rev_8_21_14_0_10_35_32]PJC23823.1 MAG: prolyl-tRNA synthetase [candidate division WWE3 bacterium CG_4_9_14_0_2_um_filter_35_11]
MFQSKLFTKSKKESPADELSRNAQLLIRAGYIYKEMAGAYAYLPLGLRVISKIKSIISEEMDAIGGQEILMTALQRKELWEVTDRWNDENVDVWFKSELKGGQKVGLGWSHEEPVSEMMKQYIHSYKDLPLYVYQFQTKFRNELRSKSGILRGREFVMKDMYSYCKDADQHNVFYKSVIDAYINVFNRVGLSDYVYITSASGGAFTEFSHEFQAISEAGEDTIYVDKSKKVAVNDEVYNEKTLKDLGLNEKDLEKVTSIEVGNIFDFGKMKSEQLGLSFTKEDGNSEYVHLGSYGIGVTRLMGTIVELFNDEKGIIWPDSVAPFKVHLIGLNLDNADVLKKVNDAYDKFQKAGIEVLFDDREMSAGGKFADSDLIGVPYRVVVSAKTGDKVEVKRRGESESALVSLDNLISDIK